MGPSTSLKMFSPNTFLNISKPLEQKIRAIQMYKGEAMEFPHSRSPETLLSIAIKWGSTVGSKAVEAFQLIRSII